MTAKGALALSTVLLFLSLPAVGQTTQPIAAGSLDYTSFIDGDPVTGVTTLKERIKANPRDGEAMHAAGVLLLKSGKASEASGFFARASACGVNSPAFAYNQSLAMLRMGQAVKAAGQLNKYLQTGGTADERFLDLFGDCVDRASRAGAISNKETKKNWDDVLAGRIRSLEQGKPGMRKWGTHWLNGSEWGPIQSSIDSYKSKIRQAEEDYDNAVDSRKDAESHSRTAQKNIPDANANDSNDYWYRDRLRARREEANRAKEAVRRAQDRERQAKKELDTVQSQAPRPIWEDKHAPIWGDVVNVGGAVAAAPLPKIVTADAGATLARGMTVEEVQAIMGVQATSVTEDETGSKFRLYDLPDRTVRVRFRGERVISYEEQVKTQNSPALPRVR